MLLPLLLPPFVSTLLWSDRHEMTHILLAFAPASPPIVETRFFSLRLFPTGLSALFRLLFCGSTGSNEFRCCFLLASSSGGGLFGAFVIVQFYRMPGGV